jgi:hypothetical protein
MGGFNKYNPYNASERQRLGKKFPVSKAELCAILAKHDQQADMRAQPAVPVTDELSTFLSKKIERFKPRAAD